MRPCDLPNKNRLAGISRPAVFEVGEEVYAGGLTAQNDEARKAKAAADDDDADQHCRENDQHGGLLSSFGAIEALFDPVSER